MHMALCFLAFLLPGSFLLGIVIASCFLMVWIPLRRLWCQKYRLPSRRTYNVRLTQEQKRRIRQRHQRAIWLKDRRERQRLHRAIWKLTRKFCVSENGVTSVAGTNGHVENCDPVQKASARHLSTCKQHQVPAANQYSRPCAQSTQVSLDDHQLFHEACISCAPKSQGFARCSDGDAVLSKEFHLSSAKQYSTPCAQSTPVFAGDQQISHEASMSCPQRPQAFAHSIDGDADAYIPDAIIVPGSSHFDFHIVMHVKFFMRFRSNHLQATCLAQFLVVSCRYPNYNCL